jgi:hypothetical protein
VTVVIDIGDEKRDRPLHGARFGHRDRGGVYEGVVCGEPSLLVEKNGMLLRGGRHREWWVGQP